MFNPTDIIYTLSAIEQSQPKGTVAHNKHAGSIGTRGTPTEKDGPAATLPILYQIIFWNHEKIGPDGHIITLEEHKKGYYYGKDGLAVFIPRRIKGPDDWVANLIAVALIVLPIIFIILVATMGLHDAICISLLLVIAIPAVIYGIELAIGSIMLVLVLVVAIIILGWIFGA